MEMNYTPKIRALENIVKRWEKRNLTPLGKIIAIKVLFIPAFNHLFITLPSPNQEIVNHINSILFNFLWSNNVKIKPLMPITIWINFKMNGDHMRIYLRI